MNMNNPYGYCPICYAECVMRERRMDGNDYCKNNHCYPSRDAITVLRRFGYDTTYATPRFFVDAKGKLWFGPTSPDNTLHFSCFYGFNFQNDPVWVLESSELPSDCRPIEELR